MSTPTVPEEILSISLFDSSTQFWVGGDYHPAPLADSLREQPSLSPFEDESGNLQSAFRLDADPEGAQGYWVTAVSTATQADIDTGVAGYPAKLQEYEETQAAISAPNPTTTEVINAITSASSFNQAQTNLAALLNP